MTPPKHEQFRPPDVDDDREVGMGTRWKVDRHIPVATIISLGLFVVVQTATLSYGWATMSSRIEVLERQVTATAPFSERLVKLETKFDGALESLTEIKNILRQVPTRAAP